VEAGNRCIARAFSCDVAEMISLFQDHLDNPRWLGSLKDLSSNYQRSVSVVSQQLDTCSFVDFMKRQKGFHATYCTCERPICPLRDLAGDFRYQLFDSLIVDLLVIETKIT
jgi:hypothetical protein